jgi:hypothetical protein
MAKDAYYFPHDSNAREDRKHIKVMSIHGWEAYGVYWAFIEILREQDGYKLHFVEGETEREFAFQMRLQCERISELVKAYIDSKLLVLEDGFLYSESLLKRMAFIDSKRQKARESAQKRWNKNSDEHANAQETQTDRNASKVKDSKEKETKKKVNKIKTKGKESDLVDPPEALTPNEATQKAIAERGFTEYEGSNLIASCLDWHRSKGNQMKDWQAACRTWIRKQNKQPSTDDYDFSGIRHAANNRTP